MRYVGILDGSILCSPLISMLKIRASLCILLQGRRKFMVAPFFGGYSILESGINDFGKL